MQGILLEELIFTAKQSYTQMVNNRSTINYVH